ncbi:retrotransposon protein, putative, ty1-copia subclass [Tanacetum coccineum]
MKGYMDQLQALGKPYDNDMAINLINRSLNKDFGDFVRNFNMHCVGKTVSDLHALLIDYEKGLKDKAPTPQVLAIQKGRVNKPKPQANKKGKSKGKADKNKQVVAYQPKPKQNPPQKKENPKKDQACHHCNVVGHWKRNCPLYLEELRTNKNKKAEHGAATSGNLFMIELFNLTHKLNSWVYDTGCGIHICNTLQGFRVERKLSYGEQYLHVGNGAQAAVEAIGVFNLVLPSGLVLSLNNCHYAPSIIRGVVSFSRLLDLGFVHTVTSNGISVSSNGIFYFSAISVNGVFEIDMNDNVSKLAYANLQGEGFRNSINDESYDKCESCISGKMTKKPFNNNIERSTDLLGLLHTNVCRPLRHVSRKGASYFLTFTDDFSCYGYVYLLKHKHEVFETFKVFKSEVELQLGKNIKALRSDRGGEYLSQEFKEYLGAVDWKSKKQTTIAMSAAQAEYMAASEAAMEAVWIRKFVGDLGVMPSIKEPINMYCDNSAAIIFANDSGIMKGARHFLRRYHFVREQVESGEIKILKVHTDDNLADPFTKALPRGKVTDHANGIGLQLASSFMHTCD